MSRRTDWVEEVEKDNENQIMLKKWLEIRVMKKEQLLIGVKEEIIEKIKKIRSRWWWSSKNSGRDEKCRGKSVKKW